MSTGDRSKTALTHVTIIMPEWLRDTLVETARERGQTWSALARTALESHLMETSREHAHA